VLDYLRPIGDFRADNVRRQSVIGIRQEMANSGAGGDGVLRSYSSPRDGKLIDDHCHRLAPAPAQVVNLGAAAAFPSCWDSRIVSFIHWMQPLARSIFK
jgi:hypothetical protein